MRVIEYAGFEALCESLAPQIAQAARRGIEQRGAAALALAGGSTPFPLYRRLARESLDWSRVTLLPGDERWVAGDHKASNLRAIRETFAATGARLAPLVPESPGATPSLDTARESLSAIGRSLDVCVLGMGGDGHFASLFPGAPELATALDPDDSDPLVVVTPDPLPEEAPFARVSLTLSAIAASRRQILLLRGEGKRQVLEAAAGADPVQYPIAALLAQPELPLEIHWSP